MNITLRILSPAIVSACLALPLLAEHDKSDPSATPQASLRAHVLPGESTVPTPLGHVARVSDVIGLEVRNLQDEKLGKVNDLGLDINAATRAGDTALHGAAYRGADVHRKAGRVDIAGHRGVVIDVEAGEMGIPPGMLPQ